MYSEITEKNDYDIKKLKKLQENVSNLDKLQQFEIFKLIKKYNNKLTENKNGIFINLSCLSNECLDNIENFIKFSIENKKRLVKMELMSEKIFKNSILNNNFNSFEKFVNDKNINKQNNILKNDNDNMTLNKQHIIIDNYNLEKEFILYNDNDNDEYGNEQQKISNKIKEIKNEPETETINDKEDITRKNYKYSGKIARLFKKCKEINKNINLNSILSYHSYNETLNNETDDEIIINNLNELTEDKI